jgi:exocyst complex component 6
VQLPRARFRQSRYGKYTYIRLVQPAGLTVLMPNIDLENDVRQIVNYSDSSTSGNEGVDAILAPIFKDVLDHDAGQEFTELLEAFSVEKVHEIEKMCNSNHQEFVGAVEKLLKARKGAAGLRVQSISCHRVPPNGLVLELNDDLQKSGNSLTSVMRQQIEKQTTLRNIDEAIDTLNVCLLPLP